MQNYTAYSTSGHLQCLAYSLHYHHLPRVGRDKIENTPRRDRNSFCREFYNTLTLSKHFPKPSNSCGYPSCRHCLYPMGQLSHIGIIILCFRRHWLSLQRTVPVSCEKIFFVVNGQSHPVYAAGPAVSTL